MSRELPTATGSLLGLLFPQGTLPPSGLVQINLRKHKTHHIKKIDTVIKDTVVVVCFKQSAAWIVNSARTWLKRHFA